MIILFSDMFMKSIEQWRIFNFTILNGAFGQTSTTGDMMVSFRGSRGMEAKDGLLFALELVSSVILSLGIISAIGRLGGLRAAQQLMTPVLRPLLNVSGICSLASIANSQSIDATTRMTREMVEEGIITEQEHAIFVCWQVSGSTCITSYFSPGATLFTMATVPVVTPLAVIFVFKSTDANLLRIWTVQLENHRMQQEA